MSHETERSTSGRTEGGMAVRPSSSRAGWPAPQDSSASPPRTMRAATESSEQALRPHAGPFFALKRGEVHERSRARRPRALGNVRLLRLYTSCAMGNFRCKAIESQGRRVGLVTHAQSTQNAIPK